MAPGPSRELRRSRQYCRLLAGLATTKTPPPWINRLPRRLGDGRMRISLWGFFGKKINILSWSEWSDSNTRPPRPERGALPDCATLRDQRRFYRPAIFDAQAPIKKNRLIFDEKITAAAAQKIGRKPAQKAPACKRRNRLSKIRLVHADGNFLLPALALKP